ncbi:MAG: Rieske (2Fe-2S) protein [Polyangia bacterium]
MSTAVYPPRFSSPLLNRRQLLRVAGTSAGAIFLARVAAGCQNATGSPPTGPVGGIKTSDLKLNELQILSSNVAVAEDSNGIYAMSAICTHAGCILDDGPQTIAAGLSCPCHGSMFDGNGNVTQGPARAPLQHYQVTIAADGSITIDGSKPVAANVRVPVG